MNDKYKGPVRLQPKIPWGKRDKATGFAVLRHMVDANPPTVIPWSIYTRPLKRALKHDNVFDAGVHELSELLVRRSARRDTPPATPATPAPPTSDSERLARRIAQHDLRMHIANPRVVIVEKPVQRTASGTDTSISR